MSGWLRHLYIKGQWLLETRMSSIRQPGGLCVKTHQYEE